MGNRNKEAIVAIMLQREGADKASADEIALAMLKEADGNGVFLTPKLEFGHSALFMAGVHIDSWGAGPLKIAVGNETFEFEDSDRFGPVHCENGEPSGYQFMQESKFWPAWQSWKRQGRRIADDGVTCVWEASDVIA